MANVPKFRIPYSTIKNETIPIYVSHIAAQYPMVYLHRLLIHVFA